MKNPTRSHVHKDMSMKGYLEKAVDSVWITVANGIGNFVYNSSLKLPYQTRFGIFYDSDNGFTSIPRIAVSADRDLRSELFAKRRKVRKYFGNELKSGRISRAGYEAAVGESIALQESRYEKKLQRFNSEVLPFAFSGFLGSAPEENVDDMKYDRTVVSSKTPQAAGTPSGLATVFLGPAANILLTEVPPKVIRKKAAVAGEPGYLEKEFYKTMGAMADGINYVGKEIAGGADYVFGKGIDALYWLGHQMAKHPLIVGGATITGIGAAGAYKYKTDSNFQKWVDDGASKLSAGASGFFGLFGNSQPVPAPVANDSVKATPIPQPKYDYYDKYFKVGIMIEGDKQFKQNVTNLLETFKQVTPDDYNDLIKYAPKKIVRSRDDFSWYELGNDVIELPKSVEKMGGNNDLNKRKFGLPNLYAELENAKRFKSGQTPSVIEQEETKFNYAIKIGVASKDGADKQLGDISRKLNNGTYYDGAKLNQS